MLALRKLSKYQTVVGEGGRGTYCRPLHNYALVTYKCSSGSELNYWTQGENTYVYIYSSGLECWICYDSEQLDMGGLIQPCACKVSLSKRSA